DGCSGILGFGQSAGLDNLRARATGSRLASSRVRLLCTHGRSEPRCTELCGSTAWIDRRRLVGDVATAASISEDKQQPTNCEQQDGESDDLDNGDKTDCWSSRSSPSCNRRNRQTRACSKCTCRPAADSGPRARSPKARAEHKSRPGKNPYRD